VIFGVLPTRQPGGPFSNDHFWHILSQPFTILLQQKKRSCRKGRPFSNIVFSSKQGIIFIRVPFEGALHKCMEAAVLRRIRIHDLRRHAYATIRLLRGHNVGGVSYQLGYSSIKITADVYATGCLEVLRMRLTNWTI